MVTIPNLNEKIFNEMKNLTARQVNLEVCHIGIWNWNIPEEVMVHC